MEFVVGQRVIVNNTYPESALHNKTGVIYQIDTTLPYPICVYMDGSGYNEPFEPSELSLYPTVPDHSISLFEKRND